MNGVHDPTAQHVYRVRFPSPDAPGVDAEVRGTVDLAGRTITVDLPDRTRVTLDVVTARALGMLLSDAVYGSLQPTGPQLRVERHTGPHRPAGVESGITRADVRESR